jgi:hypothetical protein
MAKVTENKTVETVFLEENAALVNETTGEVIGTTSLVSTSPDQLQKAQNMFAKIKAGEFKRGVSMAAEYLEFDSIGQSVIGQYIGIKDVEITDSETKQRKVLKAAFWLGQDSTGAPKIYNNGGVALVDAFALTPLRAFVEIKYVGKKGKMKRYEVTPLVVNS